MAYFYVKWQQESLKWLKKSCIDGYDFNILDHAFRLRRVHPNFMMKDIVGELRKDGQMVECAYNIKGSRIRRLLELKEFENLEIIAAIFALKERYPGYSDENIAEELNKTGIKIIRVQPISIEEIKNLLQNKLLMNSSAARQVFCSIATNPKLTYRDLADMLNRDGKRMVLEYPITKEDVDKILKLGKIKPDTIKLIFNFRNDNRDLTDHTIAILLRKKGCRCANGRFMSRKTIQDILQFAVPTKSELLIRINEILNDNPQIIAQDILSLLRNECFMMRRVSLFSEDFIKELFLINNNKIKIESHIRILDIKCNHPDWTEDEIKSELIKEGHISINEEIVSGICVKNILIQGKGFKSDTIFKISSLKNSNPSWNEKDIVDELHRSQCKIRLERKVLERDFCSTLRSNELRIWSKIAITFILFLILFILTNAMPIPPINHPPEMVEFIANPGSTSTIGDTVKWTANAMDNENDLLEYRYYLDNLSVGYWSVSKNWTWSPSTAGTHTIGVKVRDNHHSSEGDCSAKMQYTIVAKANQPPESVTLIANPESPQEAGTSVTFTATASDPDDDKLDYIFLLDEQIVQSSTSNTWIWSPSTTGTHTIGVKVRDNHHSSEGDLFTEVEYTIDKANQPPGAVTLIADPESPQEAGTSVTFTATASDPDDSQLDYIFLLDKQIKQSSTSNTWIWSPSTIDARTHTVGVKVRDNHHSSEGDCSTSTGFVINRNPQLATAETIISSQYP